MCVCVCIYISPVCIHASDRDTEVVSMSWLLWLVGASGDIGVCISLWNCYFIVFGYIYPEVGLLDHVVILCLIFEKSPYFFPSGCTDLHSHQWYAEVPLFSHQTHWHLYLYFLIIAILTDVNLYLILILVCISLMTSDAEHFSCMCWSFACLWEKCPFKSSAHFKVRLSFCYWVVWVPCIVYFEY